MVKGINHLFLKVIHLKWLKTMIKCDDLNIVCNKVNRIILALNKLLNLFLGEGEGDHLDEDGEREDGVAVGVRNAEAHKTAVDPLDA